MLCEHRKIDLLARESMDSPDRFRQRPSELAWGNRHSALSMELEKAEAKQQIEKIIKASPIKDKDSLTNLGKSTFFFRIIVHKIPAINSQALVGSKKNEPALPSLDSISAKTKLSTKTNGILHIFYVN